MDSELIQRVPHLGVRLGATATVPEQTAHCSVLEKGRRGQQGRHHLLAAQLGIMNPKSGAPSCPKHCLQPLTSGRCNAALPARSACETTSATMGLLRM